jgi:hypothetical protein
MDRCGIFSSVIFFFFFVNHKDLMVKSQLNIDGTSFPNENTLVLFVNLLIGDTGVVEF